MEYPTPLQHGAIPQALNLGVDALLADFREGNQALEFDFSAEEQMLLEAAIPNVQSELHRNAVLSNFAAHGAAVRPMVTSGYGGIPQAAWRTWSPREELDQSSADSMPSTSLPQQTLSALPSWQLNELSPEVAEQQRAAPQAATSSPVDDAAAAQQEKERERAVKLKEKNKRAQRKFRQRQKDRRESAERTAMELAEQLQKVQLEKETLAKHNQSLEKALAEAGKAVVPQELPKEPEPSFTPAKGWSVFHPTRGMVLSATCNPPRPFTHRQMLSLSLRDITKIMSQLIRRLQECLSAIDAQPPNPTAEARVQALLYERHAIMSYLAVNTPRRMYEILSCKMVDPPQPNPGPAPREHWLPVLDTLNLSQEQMHNLVETRMSYIGKIRKLMLQRQEIVRRMQELEREIEKASYRVPESHLEWSSMVAELQGTVTGTHRCHACLMVRVWYGDCFTPVQVARILCAFYPYPVDIYEILRELVVRRRGEPSFMEFFRNGLGENRIEEDDNDVWPSSYLTPEALKELEEREKEAGQADPLQ